LISINRAPGETRILMANLLLEAVVPLLELENISKSFGAVEAVVNVSLSVEPGEIIGLMGDNGAGKSVLCRIIAGNYRPSSGTIRVDGKPVEFHGPIDARRYGIDMVQQNLALCDNLSAASNVFLSRELMRRFGPISVLDYKRMYERSAELFSTLKSETRPRDLVRSMSGGQRQAVAIARTMLQKARLVIMDEPTAAISIRQVEEVLKLMKQMRDEGIALIFISHRLPDIFDISDRIVVMRRGAKVCDKPKAKSSREEVVALITGALETA
jgi:simple sugar transport system ATP-binding protein